MKIDKSIRTILLILIAVYFAKGSLYPIGSVIYHGTMGVILLISIFYLFRTLLMKNNKNLFYIMILCIAIINIVSFFFIPELSSELHQAQLSGILMALLPFFPFYFFSQKNILYEKHLIVFLFIMIPIAILNFISYRSQYITANITNNASYLFVFLMPYLFLFQKNKNIASIILVIMFFFILQGAKRGAIVISVPIIILFIYYRIITLEKDKRLSGFIIIFSFLVLGAYFAYDFYQQNEFLIERMTSITEGESSDRDTIYSNLFSSWYNSNDGKTLLFGRGFGKTLEFTGTGNFAHNDWLELITNFGIIGVLMYFTLFLFVIRYITDKNTSIKNKYLMLAIFITWLSTTVFSMNYLTPNAMLQYILLALLLSKFKIITTRHQSQRDIEY